MRKIFHFLYFLSAIVYLIGFSYNNILIFSLAKPIPLILLIFLVRRDSLYNQLITLGLIFSLVGDILLMKYVDSFLLGLIAFFVAHLFYIAAFFQKSNKLLIISSIPFYLYGFLFFIFIKPGLGEMLFPVAFYMFIITTMLWRSFVQRKEGSLAKWAFFGAFLFTISDSLIAISKFHISFFLESIFIMITYWAAQYSIYKSTVNTSVNDEVNT